MKILILSRFKIFVLDVKIRKLWNLLINDKDFGELVFKMKVPTRGIILIRYPPKNPEYITQRLKALLTIPPSMDFENHFCTVTEEKIRLVKLSSL